MSDTPTHTGPTEGLVLGSYRIVQELTSGGMGTVFRAEHVLLGRPAAIKLLRRDLSTSPALVQRFVNEAKAVTACKHPGIVEVYDFGYTRDDHAFIVMEFLDGESLGRRLAHSQLTEVEATAIAHGIASALKAAHRVGVIHRDLKPDNVFLVPDPDGGVDRTKVLDFGIAKLADGASTTRNTETGSLIGTPLYMAPEQARAAAAIDHRADLYSLGCILYHMLTGRPPFVAEGAGEIIALQLFGEVVPPSELAPVTPEMDRLVLRLLEKEPARRFATAGELVHALIQLDRRPTHRMTRPSDAVISDAALGDAASTAPGATDGPATWPGEPTGGAAARLAPVPAASGAEMRAPVPADAGSTALAPVPAAGGAAMLATAPPAGSSTAFAPVHAAGSSTAFARADGSSGPFAPVHAAGSSTAFARADGSSTAFAPVPAAGSSVALAHADGSSGPFVRVPAAGSSVALAYADGRSGPFAPVPAAGSSVALATPAVMPRRSPLLILAGAICTVAIAAAGITYAVRRGRSSGEPPSPSLQIEQAAAPGAPAPANGGSASAAMAPAPKTAAPTSGESPAPATPAPAGSGSVPAARVEPPAPTGRPAAVKPPAPTAPDGRGTRKRPTRRTGPSMGEGAAGGPGVGSITPPGGPSAPERPGEVRRGDRAADPRKSGDHTAAGASIEDTVDIKPARSGPSRAPSPSPAKDPRSP